MPKNKVSDLITDQEIAFARLVLSGTMTDHAAAQAVGLNPDTAAYTKAKPRVRAYMLEHRAAMQQQLLDQEADLSRRAAERLRQQEQRREQVLDRLWEIAKLSPEMTRGSITGQVKALQMIVAIESLIPDRRAGSSGKESAVPATHPSRRAVEPAVGIGRQPEQTMDHQPDPALAQEDEPGLTEPEPTPAWAEDAPALPAMPPSPAHDLSESPFANPFGTSKTTTSASHVPAFFGAPDTESPSL